MRVGIDLGDAQSRSRRRSWRPSRGPGTGCRCCGHSARCRGRSGNTLRSAARRSARARARSACALCGDSPFGPTPAAAALGQRSQIARRRLAGGNELVRILVAQLRRAKNSRARVSRATRAATRRDSAARARRRAASSARHSSAARSRAHRAEPCAEWRSACPAACGARGSACARCRLATSGIVELTAESSRASCSRRRSLPAFKSSTANQRRPAKRSLQPAPRSLCRRRVPRSSAATAANRALQAFGDVVAADAVFALGSRAARSTDEPTQRRIRRPVFGEHDDFEAVRRSMSSLPMMSLSGSPWPPYARARLRPRSTRRSARGRHNRARPRFSRARLDAKPRARTRNC